MKEKKTLSDIKVVSFKTTTQALQGGGLLPTTTDTPFLCCKHH